jgi:hypothetical protein
VETYKSSNTESTLKQLHRCQNHTCIDVTNNVLQATRQHHQALCLSASVHQMPGSTLTACLIDEIRKHESDFVSRSLICRSTGVSLCRAVVWRRACQHRNADDSKPSEGPDDLIPSIYFTEPLGKKLTGTLSNIRKNRVHQGIDDERSNIISNVDEELMPTLRLIFLQSVSQP